MLKRILVTGANGYLGSHLVKELSVSERFTIYAFDRDKEQMKTKFKGLKNIHYFDSVDFNNNELPFKDTDIVVHCAFARSMNGPDLSRSICFSKKIFVESVKYKCMIVNISSRSVYGQNINIPWDEKTPVEPITLYSIAKYSTELLLESIALNSVKFTNLRLASLVGPNFDDRIINKLIIKTLNNGTIKITGGMQKFSYLYINDAVLGIIALLNKADTKWDKIYNLGSKDTYTLLEIAKTIKRVSNEYNIEFNKMEYEDSDLALVDGMDCNLLYKFTGWEPSYDLEMMIRSIFEYIIKDNRNVF